MRLRLWLRLPYALAPYFLAVLWGGGLLLYAIAKKAVRRIVGRR